METKGRRLCSCEKAPLPTPYSPPTIDECAEINLIKSEMEAFSFASFGENVINLTERNASSSSDTQRPYNLQEALTRFLLCNDLWQKPLRVKNKLSCSFCNAFLDHALQAPYHRVLCYGKWCIGDLFRLNYRGHGNKGQTMMQFGEGSLPPPYTLLPNDR
ncbi:hypothetical protein CEXT_699371 [Caerostris extrusa]|uniref:Uncharacterized protein n=1 Tax=Caerostris extrusa TaxID=172846 RepID=A0AAV4W4M9_CAEEX|nr:hypothetical protein CEXT_699371 [Caerostris extrusa]